MYKNRLTQKKKNIAIFAQTNKICFWFQELEQERERMFFSISSTYTISISMFMRWVHFHVVFIYEKPHCKWPSDIHASSIHSFLIENIFISEFRLFFLFPFHSFCGKSALNYLLLWIICHFLSLFLYLSSSLSSSRNCVCRLI